LSVAWQAMQFFFWASSWLANAGSDVAAARTVAVRVSESFMISFRVKQGWWDYSGEQRIL
jgi:hypothetical protein